VASKLSHFWYATGSATSQGYHGAHPDFAQENASKPKEVRIELVSDDPEVNLEIGRTMNGRGVVLCHSDAAGKAMRRMKPNGTIDPNSEFVEVQAGSCGDHCPFSRQKQCKLASVLRFRIPGRTPLGHVWQFRTLGWNSAQELLGSMVTLREMAGGHLAGMPLKLTIHEQKRSPIVNGARQTTTFYSVGLAFDGEDMDALMDAVEKAQVQKARASKLGVMDLEAQLKAQGATIGREDENEARSVTLEFFTEDGDAPLGAPDGSVAPLGPEDSPRGDGEPAAQGQDAPVIHEETPEAPAKVPTPAGGGKPMTSGQRGMLAAKARENGIAAQAMEAWMARPGITTVEASGMIQRLMAKDPAAKAEVEGTAA